MSLLLDALKKAADDKQKTSRFAPVNSGFSSPDSTDKQVQHPRVDNESESTSEEPGSRPEHIRSDRLSAEELTLDDIDAPAELTLEIESDTAEIKQNTGEPDSAKDVGETAEKQIDEIERVEASVSDRVIKTPGNDKTYAISDDALSLLITKTNRDVRKDKTILIAVLLISCLAILVAGGLYYYTDTQAEIAALERKHQIAMQAMRAKSSNEKTPEELKVIRTLVSDAELEEKVEYAKEHISNKKPAAPAPRKEPAIKKQAIKKPVEKKTAASSLSIQKTSSIDPVTEKLENAWLAYEEGNYSEAKALYHQVINIEQQNRDALLGVAAIAVIEKDIGRAQQIYRSLLKHDPGDAVAAAALAGLRDDESSLESSKEHLLAMLGKNPDDAQLNFSLANIFAQQNNWKAAQKHYFNAWKQDSDNADYIYNLAVSLDQLSKQQQALSLYKDSLEKSYNRRVNFSREVVKKRINELAGL